MVESGGEVGDAETIAAPSPSAPDGIAVDPLVGGGGLALAIDQVGLLFLPSGVGETDPQPRAYAVLTHGEVFLLNTAGIDRTESKQPPPPALEPVPAAAQDAVRGQHPGRELSFPRTAPDRAAASRGLGSRPDLRWADPHKINLVYGGIDGRKLTRMRGEVLDGDWDTPYAKTFDELDVTQAIQARFLRGERWEDTPYYARVLRAIQNGTPKWGCRDQNEFRERLDVLDALFDDMRVEGYRSQAELGMKNLGDEVRVGIGRDGRLLFLDGRHRLAMARTLGIPRIPVHVVARHRDWMRFREELLEYIRPRRGRVYQTIDHPDLRDLPAHHGPERVAILKRALADYDASGKRLLDIGAHWGAMTQVMTEVGFDCTAVESNRRCARFARWLSVATEANFDVWQGDIFEFPQLSEYDAVLALNVFHHFIKSEEQHARLIALLERLDVELMLFEPHVSDPPAQMKGAYRNYPEREFVELVARHVRLERVEFLERAPDGRALYMLRRV